MTKGMVIITIVALLHCGKSDISAIHMQVVPGIQISELKPSVT